MKRKIRKGVFETNSSSTHSICITKDVNLNIKRNFISFNRGEFGWEFDEYGSVNSKASYLYEAILNGCDYGEEEAMPKLKRLKELLAEKGIDCEFQEDGWGYIDHSDQAWYFVEYVLADSDHLMSYLFGDSVIFTGNDNESYEIDYSAYDDDNHVIFDKGN